MVDETAQTIRRFIETQLQAEGLSNDEDLVDAGIVGIMNFAPTVLQVPEDVMVNNVNLAIELENLSYFIQQ